MVLFDRFKGGTFITVSKDESDEFYIISVSGAENIKNVILFLSEHPERRKAFEGPTDNYPRFRMEVYPDGDDITMELLASTLAF